MSKYEFYIHVEPWGEGTATVVLSRQDIIDTPHRFDPMFKSEQHKVEHYQTVHWAIKLTQRQYEEYNNMLKDFFERVEKENENDPHSSN